MGAIPSSQQIQRFPGATGYSSPFGAVDMAARVPDPAKLDAAFASGFNQANAISDNMLLRPKQVQAAGAQADLATVQAKSDMGMVPLRAVGETSTINTNMDINANIAEQQRRDLFDRNNPGASTKFRQLLDASKNAAWESQASDQAVLDAHKEVTVAQAGVGFAGANPPPGAQDYLDKSNKKLETAQADQARKAALAKSTQTALNIELANQTAAGNTAGAGAATSETGLRTAQAGRDVANDPNYQAAIRQAPINAAMGAQVRSQGDLSKDTVATSAQLSTEEEQTQTLITKAVVDARTADIILKSGGDPSTPEGRALVDLQGRAAANGTTVAAYLQNLQSAYTMKMIQSGVPMFGGPFGGSPEELAKTREEAQKLGIPTFNADMSPKFIPQLSGEIAQKNRVVEAKDTFKTVNDDAAKAASMMEKNQAIQSQLGTGVSTGYLYGLFAGTGGDRVLAQWGVKGAITRSLLDTVQNQQIPEMTRGLGRMTAPDIALFKQALAGAAQTPEVNAAILAMSNASSQRDLDRQKFYNQMVGPLTVNQVDGLWNDYLAANPLFDKTAAQHNAITVNRNMLTPQEYVKLVQTPPASVVDSARALTRGLNPAALPMGQTAQQTDQAPATTPFLQGGTNGAPSVIANPKYWQPIIDNSIKYQGSFSTPSKFGMGPVDLTKLGNLDLGQIRPAVLPGG